jgi:hypothetical protein
MYTANNQVILDELYDQNIQPDEDDVIEYAQFIGIDVQNVSEPIVFLKYICFL